MVAKRRRTRDVPPHSLPRVPRAPHAPQKEHRGTPCTVQRALMQRLCLLQPIPVPLGFSEIQELNQMHNSCPISSFKPLHLPKGYLQAAPHLTSRQ